MHDLLFRPNFQNLINVLNLIGLTALDGYKSKMTLTNTGSAKFAEPVIFCGGIILGGSSRAPSPTTLRPLLKKCLSERSEETRGSENGR